MVDKKIQSPVDFPIQIGGFQLVVKTAHNVCLTVMLCIHTYVHYIPFKVHVRICVTMVKVPVAFCPLF